MVYKTVLHKGRKKKEINIKLYMYMYMYMYIHVHEHIVHKFFYTIAWK